MVALVFVDGKMSGKNVHQIQCLDKFQSKNSELEQVFKEESPPLLSLS